MATSFISTNTIGAGIQFTFTAAGQDLIVLPNVTLGSTDAAAITMGGFSGLDIAILGTLFSWSVVQIRANSSFTLAAGATFVCFEQDPGNSALFMDHGTSNAVIDGSLLSERSIGILASDGQNNVLVSGSVSAASPVFLGLFGAANDSLVNSGRIAANDRDDSILDQRFNNAVFTEGVNSLIRNLAGGVITATSSEGAGIRVGDGGNGSVVSNAGEVEALRWYGVDFSNLGAFETARLFNSGVIRGGGGSFLGNDTTDMVRNTGQMVGDVDLGAGSDSFDGRGGTVLGTIRGEAGSDTILAGLSDDTVYGGSEGDVLFGLAGDDVLTGDAGSNVLHGGDGDDTLYGGNDDDFLSGGRGDDSLVANQGNATLLGGAGDDVLASLGGLGTSAELSGGAGDDGIVAGAGDDTATGGAGDDSVFGLSGDDVISGNTGHDSLIGAAGNDALDGGQDADTLDGGTGNDVLSGGAGDDSLLGGDGNDSLDGGLGDDVLDGGVGSNQLSGGGGDDSVTGGNGADVLRGGAGNDSLNGNFGADLFEGGFGVDVFELHRASDVGLYAAAHDKVVDFLSGTDRIDLSRIDANSALAGDQAFTFIGSAGFTNGVRGQLRYTAATGALEGDYNGDAVADFALELLNRPAALLVADLLL